MSDFCVIGTGMAGFGAAHKLREAGAPVRLFDSKPHFGGHTASFLYENKFTFDEGPHVSFTKHERLQKLFAAQIDDKYEVLHTKVNNYWKGHWIKHPAQCNLHGLPTDLIVKIIEDMFSAREKPGQPQNYEEWLVASYGRTFAETFPMQYGRKYHTAEARNMSLDWLGPRLYQPSMREVLTGALSPQTADVHYISDFRYPATGGFYSYLRPMIEQMDIRLGHQAVVIDPKTRRIDFANGTSVTYERLISSVPLPELIRVMPSAPPDVRAAAAQLACSNCLVVNIGLNRPDISDWHWTYFYDDDFGFSRISFPHMFAPKNAPAGMGSVQCEIYFSEKYKPFDGKPEIWMAKTIDDLRRCGLIRPDDAIVTCESQWIRYANVIFDLDRASSLATVNAFLDAAGIQRCGRYGEWGYLWTDESFLSGERAAQRALDASLAH